MRRRIRRLGDATPILSVPSFTVTTDTLTYAGIGLAALLLVPIFIGTPGAKGRRRATAKTATNVGQTLAWIALIGGVGYIVGTMGSQGGSQQ